MTSVAAAPTWHAELPAMRTGHPRRVHGFISPIGGPDIPFGVIEGDTPGPCLLVTAGVHGSEYCSIEAALRLMRRSSAGLAGSVLVLPILNVSGFRSRSVYVMPEDGRNLNRMFPGQPDGSYSERLAHWLVTQVYPQADAYLDLHGGDLDEALLPFSVFPSGNDAAKALATAFGLPVAVEAGGEGYTINAAAQLGLPGIIAEVSGNGLWTEDTVSDTTAGIDRVMHHLGMIAGAMPPAPQTQLVTMWVPTASVAGLWYPAQRLGEPIEPGDVLGEIRDMFGTVQETVRSDRTGFILYQLSSLVVNSGEALLGVGTAIE